MSKLSDAEIDRQVVAEAESDDSWDEPITVNRRPRMVLHFGRPEDIESSQSVLEGAPVFRGTDVPVTALLENLENGVSLDGFIEKFPSVRRQQAVNVLEMLKKSLSHLKAA